MKYHVNTKFVWLSSYQEVVVRCNSNFTRIDTRFTQCGFGNSPNMLCDACDGHENTAAIAQLSGKFHGKICSEQPSTSVVDWTWTKLTKRESKRQSWIQKFLFNWNLLSKFLCVPKNSSNQDPSKKNTKSRTGAIPWEGSEFKTRFQILQLQSFSHSNLPETFH